MNLNLGIDIGIDKYRDDIVNLLKNIIYFIINYYLSKNPNKKSGL